MSGKTATEESIRGWSAVWLALVHPVTGMGEESTMKEGVKHTHLCACVWGHDVHVGARGQPVGISALLLPLGPRDKTQALSLIACRVLSSAPAGFPRGIKASLEVISPPVFLLLVVGSPSL